MAAIDSLLRVMSLRGAEAMIISTGQVPTLRRGGHAEPMAMPPIDPVMVMAFVDELVPPATRAALDAKGSADVQHAVGADGYAIAIERTTAGFRLLVRQARPALAAVAPPAAPSADDLRALVAHLGGDAAAHELARDGAVDFGATVGAARLRGHGFAHERGVGVAIRLLRTDVPSLTSLGLPEDLTALVTQRSGLVLVAGPTGSGKSTTLVALVGYLNHHRARHVVTLEDPIEFLHEPDRCLIHQREIGRHAPSFASGLRAALREAPDVIVVGELRDAETIGIALTAAETGHLVLGTVHAPGAGGAIDRLIDAYPAHQQDQARTQVAAALRCVLTQYLLPTRHGGRAVALERVPITPAIAALIRKDELQMLQTHLQTGRDAGMVPLERNLARLVRAGLVDGAVARAAAIDLDYFERAVRG